METKQPRFLLLFAMLYTAIGVASLSLPYKMMDIGIFTTSGAAMVMPFWYALGDLIAEIYGYQQAKKLIWFSVISCLVYAIIVSVMISLPPPQGWNHQDSFDYVFGSLLRATIGGDISVLVGAMFNAFLLTKWKFFLKGRFFWLRSLGATGVGEAIQLTIACMIMYAGKLSFVETFELLGTIYIIHILVSVLIVWPNFFLVSILKKKEPIYQQELINPAFFSNRANSGAMPS